MPQYFLIKEQIYTDGCVEKKDISLMRKLKCNNYNDVIKELKICPLQDSDIIYIVEVVAKRFGGQKGVKNAKR